MEFENNANGRLGFLTQAMVICSVMLLVIMVTGIFFGEDASQISSLFRLGNKGLAMDSLFQLFITSMCISGLEKFFHWDMIFRKISYLVRTILMLICVTVLIILFVIWFHWFPMDFKIGWLLFAVAYGCCITLSILVMILKTRYESWLYGQRLNEYKEKRRAKS